MAVITLTARQTELAFILVNEAFDALARHRRITEYNDDQCLVLIEMSKKKKAELDERLAEHYK
jgi:hypothetical protein